MAFQVQGVDIYTLLVEVFATGIKNLDWWELFLIAWLLHSEALDGLILQEFKGQANSHTSLVSEKVHWSVDISCSESVLIPWSVPKRTLIALIPVANASSYRWRVCDYPLRYQQADSWITRSLWTLTNVQNDGATHWWGYTTDQLLTELRNKAA